MSRRDVLALASLAGALFLTACGGSDPTAVPTPAGPSVTIPAAADVSLFEEGPLGNGSGQWLFAGQTNRNDLRRAIIRFDLAGQVPSGSTITSVRVEITQDRARTQAPAPTSLHLATNDWGEGASDAGGQEGRGIDAVEGDATWEQRVFGSSPWQAPGGDFAPGPSATTDVTGNGLYSWASDQLIADVQAWLDGTTENHGWFLIGAEDQRGGARRFISREAAAGGPALVIGYAAP